jgi:hypothetical protein
LDSFEKLGAPAISNQLIIANDRLLAAKSKMESLKSGLTTWKGISCLGLADSLPGSALVGVSHLASQVRQSALHCPF